MKINANITRNENSYVDVNPVNVLEEMENIWKIHTCNVQMNSYPKELDGKTFIAVSRNLLADKTLGKTILVENGIYWVHAVEKYVTRFQNDFYLSRILPVSDDELKIYNSFKTLKRQYRGV